MHFGVITYDIIISKIEKKNANNSEIVRPPNQS